MAATARDPEQLIVCLPQTLEQYKKQAASFIPAALMDAIRTLQDTQAAMAPQYQPPGGDGTGSLKAQRPAGKPQPGSAGRPHRGAGSQD